MEISIPNVKISIFNNHFTTKTIKNAYKNLNHYRFRPLAENSCNEKIKSPGILIPQI